MLRISRLIEEGFKMVLAKLGWKLVAENLKGRKVFLGER